MKYRTGTLIVFVATLVVLHARAYSAADEPDAIREAAIAQAIQSGEGNLKEALALTAPDETSVKVATAKTESTGALANLAKAVRERFGEPAQGLILRHNPDRIRQRMMAAELAASGDTAELRKADGEKLVGLVKQNGKWLVCFDEKELEEIPELQRMKQEFDAITADVKSDKIKDQAEVKRRLQEVFFKAMKAREKKKIDPPSFPHVCE